MMRGWLLVSVLGVVLSGAPAAAQTDVFTVSTLVGSDTAAPTTPGNFTATPVSTTQIDLDWDASSDNVSVTGYQVFRDNAQIATTTQTQYADTALTASTTYSYRVTAFDAVFNISTSTATTSTTTLAVVVVATSTPTTTPEAGGGTTGFLIPAIEIEGLETAAGETTVTVAFATNKYTRLSYRWGRSDQYDLGASESEVLKDEHRFRITDLEPGVTYEILLVLTDRFGVQLEYPLTIMTEAGPDLTPPPNVTDFSAEVVSTEVALRWTNPGVEDFSQVRIVSSDLFYPRDMADGWLVYEGDDEMAIDRRVLPEGTGRFYTIFTYDVAGNISSGAVTYVYRTEAGETSPMVPPLPDSVSRASSSPFLFDDLEFIQDNSLSADESALLGTEVTTIRLPYQAVPERLKTLVVTLTDPDDQTKAFSFLLKVNKDKTYYEAVIGALGRSGTFPVTVNFFDFKTQQLYVTEGEIEVTMPTEVIELVSQSVISMIRNTGYIFILLLLLILIWLMVARRELRVYEDKHSS